MKKWRIRGHDFTQKVAEMGYKIVESMNFFIQVAAQHYSTISSENSRKCNHEKPKLYKRCYQISLAQFWFIQLNNMLENDSSNLKNKYEIN